MGNRGSKVVRQFPKVSKSSGSRPSPTSRSPSTHSEVNAKIAQSMAQEEHINQQIRQNLGAFFRPQESALPVKQSQSASGNIPLNTLKNRAQEDDFEQIGMRNKLSADDIFLLLRSLPPTEPTPDQLSTVSKQFNVDSDIVRTLHRYFKPRV
ncbi:hypothetical protein IWQ62_004294 [Dispira parvispora]|uniref:Uncharacterized protein n=1 Tax=Dispira parvispora TaxID=1520584 RepID=A0A9W8E0T6_9FUNG|nr:hypothetical protein IWQ62_004294 [Dispira parvispora]